MFSRIKWFFITHKKTIKGFAIHTIEGVLLALLSLSASILAMIYVTSNLVKGETA